MRKEIVIGALSMLLFAAVLFAQAPAANAPTANAPATRVAVVNMQKAVYENSDGKKAQDRFMGELSKRESEFQAKQKSLTEITTKLQAQGTVLSDSAKADLTKQADRIQTDLQRLNDDAQKELGEMQQSLFRPIAERTQRVLQQYANENGFAVVFDISSEANGIVHWQEVADVTTEIIRRVDADIAKTPAAEPAAKKAAEPKAAEPAKK